MSELIQHIQALRLQSTDLVRDTERYQVLLGVAPTEHNEQTALFDLGNVQLMIDASSDDSGLYRIDFSVSDLARWQRRAQRLSLGEGQANADTPSEMIADAKATRGLGLAFGEWAVENHSIASEPANLTGLDHVVISSGSPDGTAALFGAKLGLDMRLDLTRPDWGAQLMFFRAGDAIVEIAHQLDQPGDETLDSFYGISWRTGNADACQARLASAGFDVSEVRKGRKPGTRVFTVRDAPCGVATLVIEPTAR